MTYEQAAALWGVDQITRLTPEQLEGLRLPESTHKFLLEVGLPHAEVLEVEFALDRIDIPAFVYAGDPVASGTPAIDTVYYQFGTAHRAFLFTLEAGSGRVVLLPNGGWRECGFVNSSIDGFAACAFEFRRAVEQLPANFVGSDMTDADAEQLTARLLAIDPLAFYSPDCWWSHLIRQLRGDY